MTLDLEESRTSPEYPAGHGGRLSEDSGSLHVAGKCAVQYCPKPTESHAHTRSWVWVHLQWNGILTVSCVVLPQIPHLYYSGGEEQSWKNEWRYKSMLSGKHFILACRVLETVSSYPSTAPDEMRVCWSWNKTTVTLCWLSCKKDEALTGQHPLSGTAVLSWERVSCRGYSQHWEPCHECCSASSLFWWRGWSLPCCEHRWFVSPVCRNHLGGRHEHDRKCKLIFLYNHKNWIFI